MTADPYAFLTGGAPLTATAGGSEPLTTSHTVADADRLAVLLQFVHASVEDELVRMGRPLPERRYIGYGASAVDCEQLVTIAVQVYVGAPGDEAQRPQRCDGIWSAVLGVELWRCIPTVSNRGMPPTAVAMSESNLNLARDMMAMLSSARAADSWGPGVMADVAPLEPQGGFAGVRLNLIIALP